jgi:pimeloyl-ACP methyl ester carboxylesterase
MQGIHEACLHHGRRADGSISYVDGANIAGFVKVADAMLAQGVVSVGAPVNLKIEGVTHPLKMPALHPGQVKQLAYSVMNEKQISEFEAKMEMNLSISAENLGRFRVNVFVQRGETGMVVRYIKNKIPPLAALGLPPILEKLVLRKRGLVLVTGATGSGKSTTLASMINYRNENVTGHILTIEDPLEFLHAHKRSVVNQREVGIDTLSYEDALKNALREAPDVIMIGEIRDRQTMKQAISYAETGHLCLSTLHANNATLVEGTFTSIPDVVASYRWGWLPVGPLITQRFAAVERVAQIGSPLLVVHGSDDRTIAPALGRRLFDAAAEPKRFELVEGASHHNANAMGQAQYRAALVALFGVNAGSTPTTASASRF